MLLLSRDEAYALRRKVIVAEVTTTFRGTTCEVRIGPGEGVPRASVINLEALATIPKEWLMQRAGSLRREKAALVDEALRFALGMPG